LALYKKGGKNSKPKTPELKNTNENSRTAGANGKKLLAKTNKPERKRHN